MSLFVQLPVLCPMPMAIYQFEFILKNLSHIHTGTKIIKYLARIIKWPTWTIKRPARTINGTKLETDLTEL